MTGTQEPSIHAAFSGSEPLRMTFAESRAPRQGRHSATHFAAVSRVGARLGIGSRPARCLMLVRNVVFAAFSSTAIAQTFIVDAANGPGTNFTEIATAVAAVPDGAVLMVRAGSY